MNAVRALLWGVLYAGIVVALIVFGHAGERFIYQGF
jgi:hypothetical protein